jgi:hypothetical protein
MTSNTPSLPATLKIHWLMKAEVGKAINKQPATGNQQLLLE